MYTTSFFQTSVSSCLLDYSYLLVITLFGKIVSLYSNFKSPYWLFHRTRQILSANIVVWRIFKFHFWWTHCTMIILNDELSQMNLSLSIINSWNKFYRWNIFYKSLPLKTRRSGCTSRNFCWFIIDYLMYSKNLTARCCL